MDDAMRHRSSLKNVAAALALAGTLGLIVASSPAQSGGNLEELVIRKLAAEAGTNCLQGGDVFIWPAGLDAANAARGTNSGWITEGFSWVGSVEALTATLSGRVVGRDGDSVWIAVGSGLSAGAFHFQEIPLASGDVAWVRVGSYEPTLPEVCGA